MMGVSLTVKHFGETEQREDNHTALTVGKFESLHVGHRKLIRSVVAAAARNGLVPAVLTFEPNPVRALSNPGYKTVLTDAEKTGIFERLGVRMLVTLPFDRETASMPPEEFLDIVFVKLKCRFLAVGEHFRFGAGRAGDAMLLKQAGERRGAEVEVFPNEAVEGCRVSTTRVREAIRANDFAACEKLLGFPYFVCGKVVHGLKLGRVLSFPTINVVPPEDKLLPNAGVYLTKTRLSGNHGSFATGSFDGVTNVGVKNRGGAAVRCVETHLFDFDGDVYGQDAAVAFFARLRDEMSFGTLEQLREQIGVDVKKGRELLKNKSTFS